MTSLADAAAQIRAALNVDLPNGHPVADGRIHRFGPKRRCWYRLREYTTARQERVVVGSFGDWKCGGESIRIERARFSDDEWREIERRRAIDERRAAIKRKRQAEFAANRARQQWLAARVDGSSPYLTRKGVAAEGVKFFTDGTLVVPAWRFDQLSDRGQATLVGVQKIAPDGTKRFNRGMAKEGAAHRLGRIPIAGEPILLCEGLATGLTVREAIDRAHPAFIGFDAGNLPAAARVLRARWPLSPLLVCGDDDWKSEGNAGVTFAQRVVEEHDGAALVLPIFSVADRGDKDTDFNDLQVREGIGAVRTQLLAALGRLQAPASVSAGDARLPPSEVGAKRPTKLAARKDAAPPSPQLLERAQRVRERYTLIYGTDTVWDSEQRIILKVAALRLRWGEAVKLWLAGVDTMHTVPRDNVVFDPTCSVDDETHVNLFEGFAVEPRPGRYPHKWLELLHTLCGERDADERPISNWLLNWLAYPLQHPGAKMKTAIVMHGQEGHGKNLLFEAVRRIYGRHGGIVGQAELESQFNAWLSARCFLIANEVLSRQELRHHVGKLKGLVTEGEVQINDKNLPVRPERNHCNLAFLSNELQPLWIDPRDRRYMVIRTPGQRDEAFYKEVAAELDADGGVEGLYHYLMQLDLGDFNPHTKPLETDAKRQLADLGRSSAQLFYEAWKEGDMPFPFGGAGLLNDLYAAYRIFCARIGERNPTRINRFSAELVDAGATKRDRQRVPNDLRRESLKTIQRVVIITAEKPAEFEWQLEDLISVRSGLWDMQSRVARGGEEQPPM